MRFLSIVSFALGASCLAIPGPAVVESRDLAERGGSPASPHDAAAALGLLTKRGSRVTHDECQPQSNNVPTQRSGRVTVTGAISHHLNDAFYNIGDLVVTFYAIGNQNRISINIQNNGQEETTVYFGEWADSHASTALALTKLTVGGDQSSALYNCVPVLAYRGYFSLQLSI